MRYLPCPFSCSSHTHDPCSSPATFVFPNHFFLSFSMLWDRFIQIRRRGGSGGGVRIRIWQAGVTTWLFLRCSALCLKSCVPIFSPSYTYFLLFSFVYFCCCALCVRVPFFPQPTNAYLIATILTDMEQVVMNRISYSYNKNLIEQSWCDMRTRE